MGPATILLALLAAIQPADGFRWAQESERLEFSYQWPVEAEATPVLRERLQRELDAAFTEAATAAEENEALARERGFTFSQHWYEKGWTTQGVTSRLLSLSASEFSYGGGAHPNVAFAAILWDRDEDRPVDPARLLGGSDGLAARYCAAFRADRAEASEEAATDLPCPPFRERVLAPADQDGNGRFETVVALLNAYEAGGYAGGPAVLEVPLETADLVRIPLPYRAAFEAAPQGR